jgi:hypothetical protein
MKRLVKIAVFLASGLVLNAGARANDSVLPNNPYAPIVVRNVFGLNPPPTNDVNATQTDPPPKITPNGIMSIFGQLQVLFKVANPAKPGQPAKEDSYILSEGQRQDDIEIVQIDEKNSVVTFNNHGTVQELPLAKANVAAINNTATPGPGRSPNQIPGRFGGRPVGGPGGARNRGAGNSTGGGSPLATAPTSAGFSGQPGQSSQQSQGEVTPEEQAVLLEAQREVWKQQGNPAAVIIPPTMLTPQNNAGGMPPTP